MAPPPDAVPAERFLPGQVLAGRYRIVERVGRGGFGEVYRAQDLRLGQVVALKFLSGPALDPARLAELADEVRLARQVTHPHVCRVHDLVDLGEASALSMEFVDGEDLGSLLRRIGRLPPDRAVAVAHEICAGLAAIHERGVLHRDLKPANLMIDGRGHARITDFGLADLQGRVPDVVAGTPAYLAPEVLAGEAPGVASDLYALGLVLHELATGQPPWAAGSLGELMRARAESAPPPPSRRVPDLDPAMDRAILGCLERDPARRPASARAVAAMLPGGDPLAAAVARGETPTPEQVAAATSRVEGLGRGAAWVSLAALLAGLAVVAAVAPHTRLVPRLELAEPPEALAARARAALRERGHHRPAADRAHGWSFDEAAVDRLAARSPAPRESLAAARPPVVAFWYRESPVELAPGGAWRPVAWDDPPWRAGMVGARLDGRGATLGVDAPAGDAPLVAPGSPEAGAARDRPPALTRLSRGLRPVLFLAALIVGAWLARRNLRAGRGDPRRALRVGGALMALRLAGGALGGHHAWAVEPIVATLALGLYDLAYGAVFYLAIEPYVRRRWPRMLTSWARLVDGDHADPRVGRDLLIGCLAGTAIALMVAAHQAAPALLGAPPGRPDNVGYVEHQLAALLGPRRQLAEILALLRSSLVLVMGFLVILVAARVALSRTGPAVAAAFVAFVPTALPRGDLLALDLALAAAATLLLLALLFRAGLLAAAVGLATHAVLQSAPLVADPAAWTSRATPAALALVVGVGLYGFARSVRRGPTGDLLDR